MQPIEWRQQDDPTASYHAVLSRALFGIEHCPRLSPRENTKYGEAIVRLRTELGKFGDVDAFDDGSQPVPPQAACLFDQYRSHANALAEGNIRLIWTAFRKTQDIWDFSRADLMDLAGAAQEELLRSAKYYNPWRNLQEGEVPYEARFPLQFSTYAVGNMHFRMLRAAKDLQDMHIPEWRWSQYKAYWDARTLYSDQPEQVDFDTLVAAAEFKRVCGRFPTPTELQTHTEQIDRYDDVRKKHRKQIKSYAKLLLMMQPVSFDEMLTGERQYRNNDTGEIEVGEFFNDGSIPSADDVPEAVFDEIRKEIIDTALQRLSERERQVLELRFGLNDQTCYTFEEIGRYFSVTDGRIKQIEASGLKKLRHPAIRRMLWDLLA